MRTGKYAKLHHSLPDERTFAHVWDDDHLLASWARLKVDADVAWPNAAVLPRWISAEVLAQLLDFGYVVLQSTERFRMPEVDEERQEQHERMARGGYIRASTAVRDEGRFAPANAGSRPARAGTSPANGGFPPAFAQPHNVTQHNLTQRPPANAGERDGEPAKPIREVLKEMGLDDIPF
jgi:hypothetical protein